MAWSMTFAVVTMKFAHIARMPANLHGTGLRDTSNAPRFPWHPPVPSGNFCSHNRRYSAPAQSPG
ncbi:hypothetical protein CBM2587_B90313 [Cupriavidus taiwanensis]|uniref:Uncharacterized protein n=1 Tax=Cupriavidus taiwanensis TaxID=164546 RepID=A0A976A8N2_9BURK|nr:hypothetical protein CBM2587_B90313 [Cupriavidus taiwanensis]